MHHAPFDFTFSTHHATLHVLHCVEVEFLLTVTHTLEHTVIFCFAIKNTQTGQVALELLTLVLLISCKVMGFSIGTFIR